MSAHWKVAGISLFFLLFCVYPYIGYSIPSEPLSPLGAPPLPPSNVRAFDTPNDAGGSITVSWTKSPDDGGGKNNVISYEIWRSTVSGYGYEQIGTSSPGEESYTDTNTKDGVPYYYIVRASDGKNYSSSSESLPVKSKGQWFNTNRINMLIALIVFCGLVLWFIYHAKKGKELYIRRIAGLAALDEAIGRATEMGRPVLYSPSGGSAQVDEIQTLASLVILGRVARKTAEYETTLLVPTSEPLVMTVAQEVVKNSYMDAGRPDAYNPDNIRYITTDQFGYTAAVDGMMLRDRPAANFFIGRFYAESLILAETGFATGAIQIAGTASVHQLPFFVAACDYTLIGEELYAASAYLSREPVLLGSLKGQDWAKVIMVLLIIFGVVLESFALRVPVLHFLKNWLSAQ